MIVDRWALPGPKLVGEVTPRSADIFSYQADVFRPVRRNSLDELRPFGWLHNPSAHPPEEFAAVLGVPDARVAGELGRYLGP